MRRRRYGGRTRRASNKAVGIPIAENRKDELADHPGWCRASGDETPRSVQPPPLVPSPIQRSPSFARDETERRKRPATASSTVGSKRAKHLLSGLIRCSCCGANYTISEKDYYRCAGQKERGTCGNRVSVRKDPLEAATLAVLQEHLLTQKHVRLFTEEFELEMQRLGRQDAGMAHAAQHRLKQVTTERANLYQNLLSGVASPVLRAMLAEREAEKERLEAQGAATTNGKPIVVFQPTRCLWTGSAARLRHSASRSTTDQSEPRLRQ